jgi:hypothetical protein
MNPIIEGNATYKISSGNSTIDNGYLEMSYDGDIMDIAHANNKNIIIMQLNNDELMELLSRPSDTMPLDERIQYDYSTHTPRSSTRTGSNSRSRSKKSHSKSKRSKSRRKTR